MAISRAPTSAEIHTFLAHNQAMGRSQSARWPRPATGSLATLRAPPPSAHLGGTAPRSSATSETTLAQFTVPEIHLRSIGVRQIPLGGDAFGVTHGDVVEAAAPRQRTEAARGTVLVDERLLCRVDDQGRA